MTRKDYMKKLTARLSFKLSGEAVADILDEISGRFEEGAAEGMDESAVCVMLGDPSAAAAEFLRECGGENKPSTGRVICVIASLLIAASFSLADPFAAGSLGGRIHVLLPLLPLVIWLLCEGKNWRKNLCSGAYDRAMALSAALLTGAAVCCTLLVNEALRSPDSLDILYMLLCTALCLGAMGAWAFTVLRRGEKYMLVFPVLGAAASMLSAYVSFDFFAASNIWYSSDPFERNAQEQSGRYLTDAGGYLNNFLLLIILLSAACLVWAVVKRDRLSLCTLSLLLGCFASTADNLNFLQRLDPMDASFSITISAVPFIFAAVCAAGWLAVTLIAGRSRSH